MAWNDDDPADFNDPPVDVVFQVNAALFNPTGSDVITLVGSALPLSFTQPGAPMLDDGVTPDVSGRGHDLHEADHVPEVHAEERGVEGGLQRCLSSASGRETVAST